MRAILLDIEGTTTPVDFVHRTLFPFARRGVRAFLEERPEAVAAALALLKAEHAAERTAGLRLPPWSDAPAAVTAYVHGLMDQDRKSTGLKTLQGRIWEEGYREGALSGEVYPDVPRAFERWRARGLLVAIFSSGSVLAQKLLFGHSAAGDLTPHLTGYFDTATGPKREAESYRRIAAALGTTPPEVLFLSDVAAELDAAREVGMRTGLSVRSGKPPAECGHPVLRTFDEILP